MAKFASVLKKIEFRMATREQRCARSKKHLISQGEYYLELCAGLISRGRVAFPVKKCYCFSCASQMIKNDIHTLTTILCEAENIRLMNEPSITYEINQEKEM